MRIAIVNDMAMAVESLRRVLLLDRNHQIAWIARSGREAVDKCHEDTPDLILMDMVMPEMNGVVATREIMQQSPCPILIVTATVSHHSSLVFEALGAGALDAVVTPVLAGQAYQESADFLLKKISRIGRLIKSSLPNAGKNSKQIPEPSTPPEKDDWLVAIGCSTGGPNAVLKVLQGLPADLTAAVVIIQHMDEEFMTGLANWLGRQSPLPVQIPIEDEALRSGTVYVPKTNGHVVVQQNSTFHYTQTPTEIFYHPSADVFFHSVAQHWYGKAIGVLLTGMGKDGGQGLLAMKERGFHTIAQDRDSSVVYGMPGYAREIGAATQILPIDRIAETITRRIYGTHE